MELLWKIVVIITMLSFLLWRDTQNRKELEVEDRPPGNRFLRMLVKDPTQVAAWERFIPVFIGFVATTALMFHWAKDYALDHNFTMWAWILGAGAMNILYQFAWWFLALPFGFRRAATYWPWATTCLVLAMMIVEVFTVVEMNRQNFKASATTEADMILWVECPNNGTILHPNGEEIRYRDEFKKVNKLCPVCGTPLVPLTKQRYREHLLALFDPDDIPAGMWEEVYPDSAAMQSDSSGTKEVPDTTGSIMPHRNVNWPTPQGSISRFQHRPSGWQRFVSLLDRTTTTIMLAILCALLMIFLPRKAKMACLAVFVIIWLVCNSFKLWPHPVVGAVTGTSSAQSYALGGSGTSVPLPIASVAVIGSMTLTQAQQTVGHGSWIAEIVAVRLPIIVLLVVVILLAAIRKTNQATLPVFIIGVLVIWLVSRFNGIGHPWSPDLITKTRYEGYGALVLALAGALLVTVIVLAAKDKLGLGALCALVGAFFLSVPLLWALLGIQPYGAAPNQYTQGLVRNAKTIGYRAARVDTLQVGINVLEDQYKETVQKGDRVKIIKLEDYGSGIRLNSVRQVKSLIAYYGTAYTNKANRQVTPRRIGFALAGQDMWRVAYDDSTPVFWPVAMIKRDTAFGNSRTRWVPLYEGDRDAVAVDGQLVFGLNLAEDHEQTERDSYCVGSWTVTYVIERTIASSLAYNRHAH